MSVDDLLQWVTRGFFLLVGALTVADLARHRDRARLDIALAFGSLGGVILVGLVEDLTGREVGWLSTFSALVLVAQPYLLLRLVGHFSLIPRLVHALALAGLGMSWIILLAVPSPLPTPAALMVVVYFVFVEGYTAVAFVRRALTTRGVAHRRLILAALGTGLFGGIILVAGANLALPAITPITTPLLRLGAVLAGLSYYLGFAPPRALRRAWQLAELYNFLREANGDPTAGQVSHLLDLLSQAAVRAAGGLSASIALWEEEKRRLVFREADPNASRPALLPHDGAVGQAWRERRPAVIRRPADFEGVAMPQAADADVMYAIPIATAQQGWGLLLVFKRGALFPDDDLELLGLFAEQTATALENADLLARQQAMVEQLRESEEKFARAFRASPAAISIASLPDGRWLEVNDALLNLTGYSREEVIGRTSLELGLVDDVARARILEAIRTHGSVRNVEIQVRNKSGQTVDVLVSTEHIELNGKTCALTIQYDITELKRAEREIRRLNEDLEQRQAALEAANRELEAFSYSVSHDLRAPLRAVDGFSRILLEDHLPPLTPEAQRYLGLVRENAQQMGRLIDDLLSFSRLSRQPLHTQTVAPGELARRVLDDLRSDHEGRQVEIAIADLPDCQADPALLRQVFANLLANALKFTRQREMARIEVGWQQVDGETVYFIKDNGAGFDMQYADKLFGVFQRLHRAEDYEGTGVGLATVQRIVHRHGGRVWAEGQVDGGATFYFTLGGEAADERESG